MESILSVPAGSVVNGSANFLTGFCTLGTAAGVLVGLGGEGVTACGGIVVFTGSGRTSGVNPLDTLGGATVF